MFLLECLEPSAGRPRDTFGDKLLCARRWNSTSCSLPHKDEGPGLGSSPSSASGTGDILLLFDAASDTRGAQGTGSELLSLHSEAMMSGATGGGGRCLRTAHPPGVLNHEGRWLKVEMRKEDAQMNGSSSRLVCVSKKGTWDEMKCEGRAGEEAKQHRKGKCVRW